MADAAPGREPALRGCFGIEASPLPVAALTRSVDADDAADALWLRADPAFVMADAVTLRLLACGNLSLSTEEIEALAQSLKPLFDEVGFVFDAPHPQRWYLRCPRDAVLPVFSSADDALGDDLADHLPQGENARRWRSLLNEVQIVLTQHPVNAQRTRRGLPPVNSLWFWGAGVLPEPVTTSFKQVQSDDEVMVALAKQARVSVVATLAEAQSLFSSPPRLQSGERSGAGALFDPVADVRDSKQKPPSPNPLPRTMKPFGGEGFGRDASVLIDLARYRDVALLERDWFVPIDAALKARAIDVLHLSFDSGERVSVKPWHRWRFWRRAKKMPA